MALNEKLAFTVLALIFGIMLISGIALLVNILLFGIADQAADAMGTNLSQAYNASVAAQNSAIGNYSTVMVFLPWLGIGLAVIGAIGIGKIMDVLKSART